MELYIMDHPSKILTPHFGNGLDICDLFSNWGGPYGSIRSRRPHSHLPADKTDKTSKDKFQVCLDVQHFSPEEITVKTVGNQVIVEGKHEEKPDEHGHIYRHFVRKYIIPEGHEVNEVVSSLSSDGVLTIMAPKKHIPEVEGERLVPITVTGPSHKTIKTAKLAHH